MTTTHRIAIAGTDIAFDCAADQSILDAALRAGIELPYSCRKGVCGNCAGTVERGAVAGLAGAAMRNETCAADQVLYCMCTPTIDLVVRPTTWKRLDPSARKSFTARVYRNQLAAPDVSVLQLRLPAGQRVKFQAGQYLQVRLDDDSTRCYSMANPPQESDGVTLHIRHVAGGGFSARVAQLASGDRLCIDLPFGNVMLDDDAMPLVFVAGGTGFAPVKSLLDDMMKRKVHRPLSLIWGAREANGLYLLSAVDRWLRHWPDFRFIPALSDSQEGTPAGVFAGRVDAALHAHFSDLATHCVYCCGSPAMVAAVRATALAAGAKPGNFHADVFVPGPQAGPSGQLDAAPPR